MHNLVLSVPELYYPDICIFDLDPVEEQPDVLRSIDARGARSAAGTGPEKLGEDIRVQGFRSWRH
jgi:hypothetical protein